MFTAYFDTKDLNSSYEYYIKLIAAEIKECLNLSGISYSDEPTPEMNEFNDNRSETVQIIFITNNNPGIIPSDNKGIYIFFTAGNPESKRLATTLSKNLGNIYYNPLDVKIISENTQDSTFPTVTIGMGFENSTQDINWLRENTEEIAKNIIMSLSEYFGVPFVPCKKSDIAVTTSDVTLRKRPSETAEIVGSLPANTKVKIVSQWENWYVIGENGNLGYVQTKYINT